MEKPLISVIVPVYNVQDYLRECVYSILQQTYTNIEVLLVDDGSTDHSRSICLEYASTDSRVTYLYQENAGISAARNYGIRSSNGEYIVFVDSDDIVDSQQIEFLYEKLQQYGTDMAIGSYHQYSEEDGCFYIHFTDADYVERVFSRDEVIHQLPDLERVDLSFVTAWGKLFKKTLFDQVKFPEGKHDEDAFVMYKIFLQCEKIVFIKKSFYMYRKRNSSVTGAQMSEANLSYAPEARGERLALLAALGYDITEHAKWYREGLAFSLYEAELNGLQNTETARRIRENLYFLEKNL